jgi:hypothetical protein
MDEIASKYGSEDLKERGDGENIQALAIKREESRKEDLEVDPCNELRNRFKCFTGLQDIKGKTNAGFAFDR